VETSRTAEILHARGIGDRPHGTRVCQIPVQMICRGGPLSNGPKFAMGKRSSQSRTVDVKGDGQSVLACAVLSLW